MKKFEKDYWKANYSDADDMDGVFNAKEHAEYVSAIFKLESVEVGSIADLGFGLGHMFKAFIEKFKPYRGLGLEISNYAFKKNDQSFFKNIDSMDLELLNMDALSWLEKPSKEFFDLVLFNSVLQYIPSSDLDSLFKNLARKAKFVYLSAPTDEELELQVSQLDFKDEYAIRRTQREYLDALNPYFTVVSSRILESKFHFSKDNTLFGEFLFRFP